MSKINLYIKNKINIILAVFIIIQPVIDVLTNISIKYNIISIGVITRAFFLMFLLYYIIFIVKEKKKIIITLGIIFSYMAIFILNYMEINMIFRTFYFPLFLILLTTIEEKQPLEKYILASLFIYSAIILLGDITNTAFSSYRDSKTGTSGWFYAANEVGAIIAILLPILFKTIFEKINIKKALFLILVLYSSFRIGTRIPLISIAICSFIYVVKYTIRIESKRKKGFIIGLILTLMLALILVIPFTPIYKNIEIHTKFLGINSFSEIFRDFKTIDHFIFSERLSFLKNTAEVYVDSNIFSKFFGIGYEASIKMIEMDIFDIFLRHGVIGFLIYVTGIGFIFYSNKGKYNFWYILSLGMAIFVSIFAGHVFTAPAVSIYLSFLICEGRNENRNSNIKLQ